MEDPGWKAGGGRRGEAGLADVETGGKDGQEFEVLESFVAYLEILRRSDALLFSRLIEFSLVSKARCCLTLEELSNR